MGWTRVYFVHDFHRQRTDQPGLQGECDRRIAYLQLQVVAGQVSRRGRLDPGFFMYTDPVLVRYGCQGGIYFPFPSKTTITMWGAFHAPMAMVHGMHPTIFHF